MTDPARPIRRSCACVVIALLASVALAAPQPGSIGLRTFDADGNQVGGIDVRVTLLEGSWPQETLIVTTEYPGVAWRSVMTGTYEFIALEERGRPIPASRREIFIAAGSHDNLIPILLPRSCLGDLTGKGRVGPRDLAQLLSQWGPCTDCGEDLDRDGVVGLADLTRLLDAWGICP